MYFHLEHRYTSKMKVPLSVNDPFNKFNKVSYDKKNDSKYTKFLIYRLILD